MVRLRSLLVIALLLTACRGQQTPPPTPAYTGRLHVTFVAPGSDAATRWTIAAAPATTRPVQSRADAQRRSHSNATELGGSSTRVYFGLFTGLDNAGGAHDQTPAWLVVAANVKVGSSRQYGVIAFSDDLELPWVSTHLTTAAKPVVY